MEFELDERKYTIQDVIVTGVIKRQNIDYLIIRNEEYHSMIAVPKFSEFAFMIANDLSASDNLKIGKELRVVLDEFKEKVIVITPYNSFLVPDSKYLRRQRINKEELISKTKEILDSKTLTLK